MPCAALAALNSVLALPATADNIQFQRKKQARNQQHNSGPQAKRQKGLQGQQGPKEGAPDVAHDAYSSEQQQLRPDSAVVGPPSVEEEVDAAIGGMSEEKVG